MDGLTQDHFEVRFKLAYLEKKGDEFQDLFSSIMEKGYPGDFTRVFPWGNAGDKKNDGFLKSQRTLFQVYGPNDIRMARTIQKIDEDFKGALLHWKDEFTTWVFVHNSRIGLGPDVLKKLLELDAAHPDISVLQWGFAELRQEALKLTVENLASLFGPAPSQRGMVNLGLSDLVPILDHLSLLPACVDPDLRPVPADKLQKNMLSPQVGNLLKAGMSRADLVSKYFRAQPTRQDQIAESFRAKYQKLRNEGLVPDEIFVELQRFAGGAMIPSAGHQNAVLAVLAYFFEACDIFERPEGDGGSE
jgi:hypothetical protein